MSDQKDKETPEVGANDDAQASLNNPEEANPYKTEESHPGGGPSAKSTPPRILSNSVTTSASTSSSSKKEKRPKTNKDHHDL